MRIVISDRLISSEKITEQAPFEIDACLAISRPRVDLPTAGRAAMTIIFPGWKPFVSASKSLKPVLIPSANSPDCNFSI